MTCLVMQSCWPYECFFINWIQCVSVIWILISIETETKEIYAFQENRTNGMVDVPAVPAVSPDIGSCMNLVMPICPPPNNLHLLCDVTLAKKYVTCKERAVIIRYCLDLFEGIYVQSNWKICELVNNFCEDTVYVLTIKGYIRVDPKLTTETIKATDFSTLTLHISTYSDIVESTSYHSTTKRDYTGVNFDSTVTMNTSGSYDAVTTSAKPSVITLAGGTPTENTEEPLTTTYVYALIGVIVVLIEIAILFFIYFYMKKKQKSLSYRHPSKEFLEEEVIAPETTSPTQALVINNAVYEDEDIFKQDQKIYQSYLNLKYIDESSVEATPEKVILK